MKRSLTSLSALLATLVASPLLVPAPAVAAPAAPFPVSFTADPADGADTSSSGGWFVLRAEPGSSSRQALTVRNTSAREVELVLVPVDASTSAVGGASYGLPTDEVERAGRWIQPEQGSVVLAPGEARDVAFTVDVPEAAEPGDHLAGLSVAAPTDVSTAATTQRKGPAASLDLRTRRVIAVHVDVAGAAEPRIDVTSLSAAVKPSGVQLEIAMTNAGRRLSRGTGVLTLAGTGRRVEFGLDTFVPGTSIAYPLPWPDGLGTGRHQAQVELTYDGRTARWEGVLEVDEEQVEAVERDKASAATTAVAAPAASGPSTALLAVAVAGGISLAVAGQAAVRGLRRRRAATSDGRSAAA